MIKFNATLMMVLPVLIGITACASLGEKMRRIEASANDRDYDQEQAELKKRQAKAKGINFKKFDIRALKPGITLNELNEFINNNTNSGTSRADFKGQDSSRLAYIKKNEAQTETVLAGITGPFKHDTLYYIARMIEYANLSGPSPDSLIKSLKEKYGPPTFYKEFSATSNNKSFFFDDSNNLKPASFISEYYWFFDKEGNLEPEVQIFSADGRAEYLASKEIIRPPQVNIDKVFERYHVKGCKLDCGYKLSIAIEGKPDSAGARHVRKGTVKVRRFSVNLADMSIWSDAKTQKNEYSKKQEELILQQNKEKNKRIDL